MLKSVVWFITMACNNKCPYCWERQRQTRGEFTPSPFLEYSQWVNAWNKVASQNERQSFILDISGGEPFLQPGFIQMLQEFDPAIKIAITTNLRGNMAEFVQKITPQKVFSMTLSYHPTEMPLAVFLGKALLLKHRGFHITVNYVTWPEQMYLLPGVKKTFEQNNINFHVDPYAQTPYMPYEFNDLEKQFLSYFVGSDRNVGSREKKNVMCSAGMDHLVVMPEGNAFRCINDSINGVKPIGNIITDADFTLNDKETFCGEWHNCAGCDRDKVTVRESVIAAA